MIEIKVEQELGSLEKKLDNLSSKAPNVVKKAANETARRVKAKMASRAKRTYTAHVNFAAEMKLKYLYIGMGGAMIYAKDSSLPLYKYFDISQGGEGVKVKVLKSEGPKLLIRKNDKVKAFINNIAGKNQVRQKDTAKGKAGSRVTHITIAQRKGQERFHINEKYGPPTAYMLLNSQNYESIDQDVRQALDKYVSKYMQRLLEGGR